MFQIPIEEFEKNLETEFARGKKNEILFLLTNFNHLCNEEEFKDVQQYLHEACANGDLDLIKIYLSETIYNDSKDMSFKIDKQNHTASLFKIHITPQQITIPRTVKYESTDYLITSICGLMTFCTKTIKFVEDSAVKTIYGYVFSDKGFEELHFPASLDELKEGWCCNTEFLTKIVISPYNNNFIFKDNKFLLGKSDKNIDEFDVLLFARRDIREILIPSNIKIISSYAFDNCNNLEKVEFQENSNLQVIEEHAFAGSCIDKIYFPTNLNELKEGWHCNADNLTRFIISPFNNNFVFADNKFLLGKSDKNSNEFDVLHYTFCDFEKLFIPSNIKIISSYAFSKSNIKEILIPANVLRIGKSAFDCCCDLVKVDISTNSDLKIIEANAFSYTKIKEIFIPANVSKIGKSAFRNCNNLIDVDIPTNSDLKIIEANAFSYSNINKIFIPSNVIKISKFAFEFCHNLQIIEISEESKLQTFPLSDFYEYPNIIIMIPPLLKKLINSIKQFHITY